MKTEFEARFLGVDAAAIAQQLASRSARCMMPRTLMRRIVFKNNDIDARGGWLRLREQGERTFLTYKQVAAQQSAIDSILAQDFTDFELVVDLDGKLFSVEARGKLDTMIPELLKKKTSGGAAARAGGE